VPSRAKTAKEKGFAIMVTAAMLVLLIPIVGLAIDATLLYALKAKLSTAADAAAIAAARSLNVGLTLDAQAAAAQQRALDFFHANFPPNAWTTTDQHVNVNVAESAYRTRTVTVSADITAPQFFMRWLGFNSTIIRSMGKASRRDVNLILALDRSGSMANSGSCTPMITAAQNFTRMFAEGRDRLGFIAFSTAYAVGFAPSMTFQTGSPNMVTRLGSMDCSGGTSTAMALWQAYQQIVTINEPGTLNLIVLFTDGWPNAVTADYPVKQITDSRYGPVSSTQTSTSTLYSGVLPSTCRDASGDMYDRNSGATYAQYSAPNWNPNWQPGTFRGVLTQAANDHADVPTGATLGLLLYSTTSLTDSGTSMASGIESHCTMATSGTSYGRRDIAYVPALDAYGNSTSGYMPTPSPSMRFPSTTTYYVSGRNFDERNQIRPDVPMAVTSAGLNATDSAASRIRNDNNLNPVIYVIGLGSDVNTTANLRLSNDPASPIYDNTRPQGLYVFAPDATQLNSAFARVASEILRIAQ
jgi:Flp pilus assembly protein TadG